MPTLSLGVTDIPYAWGQKAGGGISAAKAMSAARKGTGTGGGKTTGDVAEILEAKYGLFSKFVEMHAPVIQHEIENSLRGHLESVLMGKPIGDTATAFAAATAGIEELFRDALTMQSYDFRIPGVPTQAALSGVSHRFKHPYAARGPRPSFIDTGLLVSSFRSWTS